MFSSFINVDNDIMISFFWKVWVVDFGCLQGSFHAPSSIDQALRSILCLGIVKSAAENLGG